MLVVGVLFGLTVFTGPSRIAAAQEESPPQQAGGDPQNPPPPPGTQPATQPADTSGKRDPRKPGQARPAARPVGKAAPAQPEGTPESPPADAQAPDVEVDPEVQKQIDEMFKSRATPARPGGAKQRAQPAGIGAQPSAQAAPPGGAVGGQPVNQPVGQPGQPAAAQPVQPGALPEQPGGQDGPAANPQDPRELARQRAEERRRRLQGERAGQAQPPQPMTPPGAGQPVTTPKRAGDNPVAPAPIVIENPLPSGPTISVNIPPAEEQHVPPEERSYGFSIKGGTYDQLVEGFARQTGLGVLGDVPKDGSVNFVTTEKLSFREALGRVRMLLFNYKPLEPYWLLRNEGNLQVIRVTDLYRIIPRDRVFQSVDEYRAANLPNDEIALVFFAPKSGSLSDLSSVRDFLPDYVRVTPLDEGRVAIFALVKDIERYLEFIPLLTGKAGDPRSIERIELKNITASDAVARLGQLMSLDGSRSAVPKIQRGTQPSLLDSIPVPQVSIVPDDVQGFLIVRAMQDKIDEIKLLLPYIDIDVSGTTPPPTIMRLQHSRAEDIVPTLQQLVSSSAAAIAPVSQPAPVAGGAGAKRPKRRGRGPSTPSAGGPSDPVIILQHPSDNAIIVLAPDETEIQHVRGLVKILDVQTTVEWVKVSVEHGDAGSINETVVEILNAPSQAPKTEGPKFHLFTDPAGDGLWFSGTEKDLQRVKELVARLDVSSEPITLHVCRLTYQQPTFVANMLREFDGSGAGQRAEGAPPAAPAPTPKASTRAAGRRAQRGARTPASTSKFTPDDPNKQLWVLCTETEWTEYTALMQKLDQPPDRGEPFVRIAVENADPETVVERLSKMVAAGPSGLDSSIRLIPTDNAILVIGASSQEIERLKLFLPEADKPASVEQRIFEIRHADATEIKSAIEVLLGGATEAPRRTTRSRPAPVPAGDGGGAPAAVMATSESIATPDMTIFQMGSRLIVRASPARLEDVAELIAQFDVEGGETDIRVFSDFPRGTDIQGIADTISSVLSGSPADRRIRAVGKDGASVGAPQGARFIPQPAIGRLVVIAPPSMFAEIEKLLVVLRHDVNTAPPVVEFIAVQYADPDALVDAIKPILEIKVRGLETAGELDDAGIEEAPTTPGAPGAAAARRRMPQLGKTASSERYHIQADARNGRIVVAAPQLIVDQVRELAAKFDTPGEKSTPILRTVELANCDPGEMIRTVKEMFGRPSVKRVGEVKRAAPTPSAGAALPGALQEAATGESLSIVEAPGSGAIVLHGYQRDVDQAEEWIHLLDGMAGRGRVFKLYELKNADPAKLFDLVVNVVDTGSRAPQPGQPPKLPRPGVKGSTTSEEKEEFATSKTFTSGDLYIQADLIADTMLVASTPAKIKQIDGVVAEFEGTDKAPPLIVLKKGAAVPSRVFELRYADASSAASDLEGVLKALWEPKDEVPQVEAATFGDYLIVSYPDEEQFDKIDGYIKEFVDLPDPKDLAKVKKSFRAPAGLGAKDAALWLRANLPEFDVELIDIGAKTQEDWGLEELKPSDKPNGHPCVLPTSLGLAADALLAEIVRQTPSATQPPPEQQPDEHTEEEELHPDAEPEPDMPVPADPVGQDAMIRQMGRQPQPMQPPLADQHSQEKSKDKGSGAEAEKEKPATRKIPAGEGLKVYYDEMEGVFVVEGPSVVVNEVSDWLDKLKDEIKDFTVKPDIRIVRVRYIDVYSAQDIIEEMFNTTKQQQAQFQRMQQQQAQMQRQQQAQQQQAMRRAGQGAGEDEKGGQPGRGAPQRGQQPQQPQQAMMQAPEIPAPAVRVYPNPRDRSLILRAETAQYPQIYKLLATVDQPKPIDSFMRIFPLRKLNAKEVEQMLSEMLGLSEAGSRKQVRTGKAGPGEGPTTAPGSTLPQTILQPTVSGSNELGIDPEDIKLFASEVSNTIIATAPTAALDFIGKIINDLESGDIPERMTKYYEMQHAAVDDVVQYLGAHFGEGGGARKPTPGGGDRAITAGGSTPNSPSFIAYSRLNMLTVQATTPQITEIDGIVARLDVDGAEDEWCDVKVAHVDAKLAADTLSKMFGAASGGGAPGRSVASSGGPKFLGDEGGGIVLFSAPKNLHDKIFATVAKLEEQYKSTQSLRMIQLKNATPSALAEAIQQAYDPKRGGKGGAAAVQRFSITPHDASRRLFIKADDDLYKEIESLVTTLDVPGDMPEFRIYPLQYASAKVVHAQMTKMMGEYMQRLGPKGAGSEAFSVQADETANALVVLGGPTVFGFLEENLRKIDVPAAAVGKQVAVTIPLIYADAGEVAATIQRLWSGRELPPGVPPPTADANRAMNTLVLRASQAQIDDVKRDVIDPLEAQGSSTDRQTPIKTIHMEFADPGTVADALGKLFRGGPNPRDQVVVTPEYGSNSVIVSASAQIMKRVEDLIAKIDTADASQQHVHVVEIKHADAEAVARTLTEIYVRGAQGRPGGDKAGITISAVVGSRALVVKCKPEDFEKIQTTLADLDTEQAGAGGEVRIVTLLYADATEIHTAMQEYLRKGNQGRGGQLTGDVRLSVMSQSNALMVAGAKEEVDRLDVIIKGMDVAGEKGSVPQIIPLKYANVGMVVSSLKEVFAGQQGGSRRNYAPPVIVADEMGNNLIVRAAPTDMKAVEDMVARIDTEDKKDQSPFKIIKLPSGVNVAEMADLVESTVNETAKARTGTGTRGQTPAIMVTPDARTNSITIAGSASLFADAEALVNQHVDMGPPGGKATRIIRASRVEADEIQRLIDQLTQQQSSSGPNKPRRPASSGGRRPSSKP